MPLSYTAPTAKLAVELSEVRSDAAQLAEMLGQQNSPLPENFPKDAVIEIATALIHLPEGTGRGCVRPLNEAQSQLATIRSQHIVHDDFLDSKSNSDYPPLFRGEPLDQKLRHLMSSVSTALQTANRLAVEERETSEPERGVSPPEDRSTAKLIERSLRTQSELEAEREELDAIKVPASREADTLRRRLTDALVLNWLGRGELRMPRIVSDRLRRIGDTLQSYPILLKQSAEMMSKGADVADYAYSKWHSLKTRIFQAGTATLREIAKDIIEYARRLEARRGKSSERGPAREIPFDFNLIAASGMIYAGTAPPEEWWPLIERLDLSSRRLKSLAPLRGLSNLKELGKLSVKVKDFDVLAELTSLRSLDLSGSKISDLEPVSHLHSLVKLRIEYTNVRDLGPLRALTSLTYISLGYSTIDLSPLANMPSLKAIDIYGNHDFDLRPLISNTNLEHIGIYSSEPQIPEELKGKINNKQYQFGGGWYRAY
jgi:hypothetical protein